MHLQVCVGACCEVLSLARWTNQQAFFYVKFLLQNHSNSVALESFVQFLFAYTNFLYFGSS